MDQNQENYQLVGITEGFIQNGYLEGFGRQIEKFGKRRLSVKVGYWTTQKYTYNLGQMDPINFT